MNRTAYIVVPGVNNWPGSSSAWTDSAVTWFHLNRPTDCAEKFEYLALPISRRILAERRAVQLAALMDRYPLETFDLVLAGHSNGCDIIARALALSKRPANIVHLFSPAVSADPRRHRLPRMLLDGRIGFLHIYLAGRDRVLAERFLGGVDPDGVREQFSEEHHTTIHAEPSFGHGTWWRPANFERSMNLIVGAA